MNAVRLLTITTIVLLLSSASVRPQAGPVLKARPAASQKLSNPLNDLLEEAQHAIESREFEAAIAPLQKVVAEQPDFTYAHFQLGYVFTALKRWEEARKEYQRATELDPKLAEGFLNLGLLLLGREPAAAVAPLRKAVELLPSQSRPRYLLGLALEQAGDLPGAIAAMKAAEALDARDVDTWLALAGMLLRANQPAPAEAKYREALAMLPDSAPARLGLAHSLEAQQKPEAAKAYRNYLELQPADGEARGRLARLLLGAKQYEAALAELDRLDAAPGPDVSALRLRADIQVAQSHWDDAIATLKRAITMAPDQLELRAGLGRLYLQKRDFASAEKELQGVLRLNPKDLDAWKDLSSAYYLEGNCPAALEVLDDLARRETPNAGAWFARATCCDKLRKMPEAIEAYQKFLESDGGKNPNQDWQAQQRIKALRRLLDKKH
jgi:tetratricopeptide (TPR) repeat protein